MINDIFNKKNMWCYWK